MPSFATKEHALSNKNFYKVPNGPDSWVSSCIGINAVERRVKGLAPRTPEAFPPPIEPIAFLVEQAANSRLPGHYHQADQFQVFVSGEGNFGIKPITGMTVHYAMAFTPYAPIHATTSPIEYYTLRNGWDPGAQWMPEHKAGLMARTHPYRHGLGLVPALAGNPDGPEGLTGLIEQNVVPFEADGLGATLYQSGPGISIDGPAPSSGRGQYWLVLKGQCQINDHAASERSMLFVAPDEFAPSITAGNEGVSILLMQFPKREQITGL
jgi:hypothetical protein